jgi:hypothetical protein
MGLVFNCNLDHCHAGQAAPSSQPAHKMVGTIEQIFGANAQNLKTITSDIFKPGNFAQQTGGRSEDRYCCNAVGNRIVFERGCRNIDAR